MTVFWFVVSCLLLCTTVFNLLSGIRMKKLLREERKKTEEHKKFRRRVRGLLWEVVHQGEKVSGSVCYLVDELYDAHSEDHKFEIKKKLKDKLYYDQFKTKDVLGCIRHRAYCHTCDDCTAH